MEISKIIEKCISIMSKDIDLIEKKKELTNLEVMKLVDYSRTLMGIEKERKQNQIDDLPTTEKELEDEILKQAEEIKKQRKMK